MSFPRDVRVAAGIAEKAALVGAKMVKVPGKI